MMDAAHRPAPEIIARPKPIATLDSGSASLSRNLTPVMPQDQVYLTEPPPAPRRKSSPFARYYERIRTPSEQKRYNFKTKASKSKASTPSQAASKSNPAKPTQDAKQNLDSRGTSLDSGYPEKTNTHDLERNNPWPSTENLREQALQSKHQRMRKGYWGYFWASLTQPQRKAVRFSMFVLILVIAIALGLGISFAVKGRVVSGVDGLTQPIQGTS